MSKILVDWGLEEQLAAISTPSKTTSFTQMQTGETMGYLHWPDELISMSGGKFVIAHYDDVLRLIYDLALASGAEVYYDNAVESIVSVPDSNPRVVLANGQELQANLVIGAGGLRSVTHNTIAEQLQEDSVIPCGSSWYHTTIPASELRDDPTLKDLAENKAWTVWMDTDRVLWGLMTKNETEFALQFLWPDADAAPWDEKSKSEWMECTPADLHLGTMEPRLARLFQLVRSFRRRRHLTQPDPLTEWTDDTGRIVLIGDAAHPIIPGVMQSTPQAVEDAVVLGSLLSHISSLSDLPRLLSGYQDVRQPHRIACAAADTRTADTLRAPPGTGREQRDAAMRVSLGLESWFDVDEVLLKAQWENWGRALCYSAIDAAEDWWTQWGRLIDPDEPLRRERSDSVMTVVGEASAPGEAAPILLRGALVEVTVS